MFRPAGKYSLFSLLDENNRVITTRIVPNDCLELVLEELVRVWEAQKGVGKSTRIYYTVSICVSPFLSSTCLYSMWCADFMSG